MAGPGANLTHGLPGLAFAPYPEHLIGDNKSLGLEKNWRAATNQRNVDSPRTDVAPGYRKSSRSFRFFIVRQFHALVLTEK
jgi:hypothetical protein